MKRNKTFVLIERQMETLRCTNIFKIISFYDVNLSWKIKVLRFTHYWLMIIRQLTPSIQISDILSLQNYKTTVNVSLRKEYFFLIDQHNNSTPY